MGKRIAMIGLAAAMAGGVSGLALSVPSLAGAQDLTNPTATTVAPGGTNQAPGTNGANPMHEILAGLVSKGTITQDQAEAVERALKDAAPRFSGPHRGGPALEAAAKTLGMTADELRTSLQGGKTIADVAKEKNVEIQKVIEVITGEVKTRLDQALKEGKITQAQADKHLEQIPDVATRMVNGQMP